MITGTEKHGCMHYISIGVPCLSAQYIPSSRTCLGAAEGMTHRWQKECWHQGCRRQPRSGWRHNTPPMRSRPLLRPTRPASSVLVPNHIPDWHHLHKIGACSAVHQAPEGHAKIGAAQPPVGVWLLSWYSCADGYAEAGCINSSMV